MFSKSCEYGLKAMIYLAANAEDERIVKLDEIAKNINSPVAFTSKILQQLAQKELLISIKGKYGGFKIEKRNLSKINLLQIVTAIDGTQLIVGCGLGLKNCNPKKPCAIHHSYSPLRNEIKKMLATNFLIKYHNKMHNGEFVLIR